MSSRLPSPPDPSGLWFLAPPARTTEPHPVFDRIIPLIESGACIEGVHFLAGALQATPRHSAERAAIRQALRRHPLLPRLLEDPHTALGRGLAGGQAGEAQLADFQLDREVPSGTSELGANLFEVTTGLSFARAADLRRAYAAERLEDAWVAGRRVAVLGCGHWREADSLAERDLGNLTAVDACPAALDRVRAYHGNSARLVAAEPLAFLRDAADAGDRFDYITALGLPARLDTASMEHLHDLLRACLAPLGEALLTSFLPDHLGEGWLDVVHLDRPFARTAAEMERLASAAGLAPRTFVDPTASMVFCEMRQPA